MLKKKHHIRQLHSGRQNRLAFLLVVLVLSSKGISAQERFSRSDYIEFYAELAMSEMKRTGIPASITLAQGCLESDDGNSRLALKANNHFGIKCHDWTGRRIYHDDDEEDECFRKYGSVKQSYIDHSEFLVNTSRYQELFNLKPDDYMGWAKGLKKAGYATSNSYAERLIQIIEDNKLYVYDQQVMSGRRVRKIRTENREEAPVTREIFENNSISYIIAKEGDTVDSIRDELDLYPWEIYRYNDLNRDTDIEPGMLLYIEPKRWRAIRGVEHHIVEGQESMWDISQIYGIKLKRLYHLNNMKVGEEVEPGTVLQLRKRLPQSREPVTRSKEKEEDAPDFQLEFEEF